MADQHKYNPPVSQATMPKHALNDRALAKEGAEAILYECSIVSHVRVNQVKAHRDGVSAELAVIQTLPAGFEDLLRSFDQEDESSPVRLSVRISWDGIGPDHWGIPEVGCHVYFNPALIRVALAFCQTLPESDPANERRRKMCAFIGDWNQKHFDQTRAGVNNGTTT